MSDAPDALAELAVGVEAGAVTFAVRAQPRSSREAIEGVREGALRVALTAPPVEGEANAALVALLAKALGLPKREVVVVAGAANRSKRVRAAGLTAAELRARLAAAIKPPK
ncbi:MAG: hypothetical protein JWM10_2964 [Myxococcaceae bacterium]|nr:hypothetical protein [Myxococcaceae bacterium]